MIVIYSHHYSQLIIIIVNSAFKCHNSSSYVRYPSFCPKRKCVKTRFLSNITMLTHLCIRNHVALCCPRSLVTKLEGRCYYINLQTRKAHLYLNPDHETAACGCLNLTSGCPLPSKPETCSTMHHALRYRNHYVQTHWVHTRVCQKMGLIDKGSGGQTIRKLKPSFS